MTKAKGNQGIGFAMNLPTSTGAQLGFDFTDARPHIFANEPSVPELLSFWPFFLLAGSGGAFPLSAGGLLA